MSSIIVAALTALGLLLASLAYYRRRASTVTVDRDRLRDSLQLIDTKTELKRLAEEIADAEKKRLEAQRDYDARVWRPTDTHDEPHTD